MMRLVSHIALAFLWAGLAPAMATEEILAPDNPMFKITRVIISPGETHVPSVARGPRCIVFLNPDGQHKRRHHRKRAGATPATIERKFGDVACYRTPSADHAITNTGKTAMISLIIEPKPQGASAP